MKPTLLIIVWAFALTVVQAKEPAVDLPNVETLKRTRHAYYVYTAALSEDDNEKRMEGLSRAIALDPMLYRAYYNRGVLRLRNNDLTLATSDFAKAVELNPEYIYAHYNLACVHALNSQSRSALTSLEQSLDKGYRKFANARNDRDLDSVARHEEFSRLLTRYETSAKTNQESPLQKLQTGSLETRADLLLAAIDTPSQDSHVLADWAMYEPDYQIRALSMALWRSIDHKRSRQALARGVYDVNGYVRKTAANAIASYDDGVADIALPILMDKELGVAFYAMQILAQANIPKAAASIAPYLRDADPTTRIMAAESLARLKAISFLPNIETAKASVPVDMSERDFYEASFDRAILVLKSLVEQNVN